MQRCVAGTGWINHLLSSCSFVSQWPVSVLLLLIMHILSAPPGSCCSECQKPTWILSDDFLLLIRWGTEYRTSLRSSPACRPSSHSTLSFWGWTVPGRPPFCIGYVSMSLWTQFQLKASMQRKLKSHSEIKDAQLRSTSGTLAGKRSSVRCGGPTRDVPMGLFLS